MVIDVSHHKEMYTYKSNKKIISLDVFCAIFMDHC